MTFALLWPLYLSQLCVLFRFTPKRKRNEFKTKLILIGVLACIVGSLRACDPNSGLGLISIFVSRSLYQEFGIICLYALVLVMLATARTLFVQMQRPMPVVYRYSMWGIAHGQQALFVPLWIWVQVGVSRDDPAMQMRGWLAQGILWIITSVLLLVMFLVLYARLTKRVRAFLITLQGLEDKKRFSAAANSANTAELAAEASKLARYQPTSPVPATAACVPSVVVPIEEEETEPDLPRSPSKVKPTRVRPALLIVTANLQQDPHASPVDPATPALAADETVIAHPNASPRPAASRNSAVPVTRAPTMSANPAASRAYPSSAPAPAPAAATASSAASSSSASQSQDRINDLHRALNKLHILAVLVTLLLVGTIAASLPRMMTYLKTKEPMDAVVHNPKPDDPFPPMHLLTMIVNQCSLATICWYGWSSTKVLFKLPFWDTMLHGASDEHATQFDAKPQVNRAPTSKNSKVSRIKPAPTAGSAAAAAAITPGAPAAVQLATLPEASPTSRESQQQEDVVAAQIPLETGGDSADTAVAAANGSVAATRTAW